MRRFLICLAVLGLLTACKSAPAGPITGSSAKSSASGYRTYRDTKAGFSVSIPSFWRIREDAVLQLPQGQRTGTAFIAPATIAPGTSLLEAQLHVSVAVGACPHGAKAKLAIINGKTYLFEESSDAGAGNVYETRSYSLQGKSSCGTVSLQVHRCNLGPDCGADHQDAYDPAPLRAEAEKMAGSLILLEPVKK